MQRQAVLDYGCGMGNRSLLLAEHGAEVAGIDISKVAVETTRERVEEAGFEDGEFRVMDAESLEFETDSFDLVCGSGVLHHLDLERAYGELARVLRPGGSAAFVEPLGHNPLINLYRRRTPDLRTPDEHPLLMRDVRLAEDYFQSVDLRFFHLQSLAAVPFRRTRLFDGLLRWLDAADRFLFRAVPPMRRYAWQVVLIASGPQAPGRSSPSAPFA